MSDKPMNKVATDILAALGTDSFYLPEGHKVSIKGFWKSGEKGPTWHVEIADKRTKKQIKDQREAGL